VTYTFDDVVATLQDVAPYDWRTFLRSRLDSTAPGAPLGGIEGSGWRLVFTETPNENVRAQEVANKTFSALFSLGFTLKYEENTKENGAILDVTPGSPAARAGIGPGMRLVAVNGRAWTPNVLREALRAASGGAEPIKLLVENEDSYQTYRIAYHEGERYPHLVREASKADLLEQLLLPRAAGTREKPR